MLCKYLMWFIKTTLKKIKLTHLKALINNNLESKGQEQGRTFCINNTLFYSCHFPWNKGKGVKIILWPYKFSSVTYQTSLSRFKHNLVHFFDQNMPRYWKITENLIFLTHAKYSHSVHCIVPGVNISPRIWKLSLPSMKNPFPGFYY